MPAITDALGISGDSIYQIVGKVALFGAIFFIGIVTLLVFAIIFIFITHDKKAIIYPVYADPGFEYEIKKVTGTDKKGNIIEKEYKSLKNKEGVVLSQPKIARAALVGAKHGLLQMRLMLPLFKKTGYIPQEYIYPEGIYFIKIGTEYIAIKKPSIDMEKGFLVRLDSFNTWKETNFIMFKKYRQKFADKDTQLRMFAFAIIAIIAVVILAGFVLWLSFKAVTSTHGDAQILASAIEAGTKRLAGGAPG